MGKRKKNKEESKGMGLISRKVVAAIEENGIRIKNVMFGDGYYIFDFGKDSVVHFTVVGLKRWLWGIWCYDEGDGKTHVSLFGEHKDYIDKFKPTQTAVSFDFVVDDDGADECLEHEYVVDEFCEAIEWVRNHRVFMKYRYYDIPGDSIVKFTLSEFWYYRIKKPIMCFAEGRLASLWLKFVAWCYERRFGRNGKGFHVNVATREPGWHPRHEFQIVYGGMSEDDTAEVYWKLRKESVSKYGYKYDRPWLFTEEMYHNTMVIDAEADDDMRGFRYLKDSDSEK